MEHKTRCSNAQYLIDYFINLDVPESQVLQGVNAEKSFISDPHNWLSIEDWHQIINNCQGSVPSLTIEDWQKIALSIKDNDATGIWKTIVKFIGVKSLYLLVPRYIKSFNTYADLKVNSISNNSVDLLIISDPNVCSSVMTRWTSGVLQAVPCALGLQAAKTHILFDQCVLKTLITNFYKSYGIEYKEKSNIIYANAKPLGRYIKLKQNIKNGRTIYTNKFSNAKPYNAIKITHDLIINNTHLIKKGDIFNAPYGRIVLTWQNPQKRFSFNNSKKLKEELLVSFNKQLRLADKRYFKSEFLLKKEQEKNNELRKTLDNLIQSKTDNNLTPSQIKIVKLIQEGKRSKDISAILNISLRTVENHRTNIRKKLNLSNKNINLTSHLISIK